VVFGLRNLEVLYVIGGDERTRLWLPWIPQARAKREEQVDGFGDVVVGMWTGVEDVELVGLGEGTFQKQGCGYGGMRGEADGHPGPPPKMIEGVEEIWRFAVEIIEKKKEMGEWKVPKVVGCEVRCIGE
jgi:hypothetical protein